MCTGGGISGLLEEKGVFSSAGEIIRDCGTLLRSGNKSVRGIVGWRSSPHYGPACPATSG
jgi:hypothetical protein